MNFTEFITAYKTNNTWADKLDQHDLPPIPVSWVIKDIPKKHRTQRINNMPLGKKRQ